MIIIYLTDILIFQNSGILELFQLFYHFFIYILIYYFPGNLPSPVGKTSVATLSIPAYTPSHTSASQVQVNLLIPINASRIDNKLQVRTSYYFCLLSYYK